MSEKDKRKYSDFTVVENNRNYVLPEITPEGPYGSPIERPLGKSSAWHEGQRSYSAFNYEYKNLHEGLDRKVPGSHPTHDDKRYNGGGRQ
ncbi:hypothetical protein [Alteribacter natronophilus]|uniref:hypothetical protein n=1 Tax=Alteribacter natronophilus TaxID=2583810 RepID=UPI00110F5FC9|nr:hypothetical protein [Alteribacter natronophilus]TMW72482.1 hypothetical protein FGB90_09815 [Alteribacter natronophilus]